MFNATKQFRHTLDLKKDEERERRRRMIRDHARVVRVSNLIYVDLLGRIGFSYTSDDSDLHRGENGVSNDLKTMIVTTNTGNWQPSFKAHSEYAKNDFFITSELYAGHYIPAFAYRVHQGNKGKEGAPINLKV
ncbi:putative serine carboxypeptidase-like 54 isoform X2 [Silene latifolia]|uniref:putative serine carboxypeptidase-like 54 isoform X2 n=1 Tax=Silene latifolia TaxID=37657 RepID=UPI003D77A7DD